MKTLKISDETYNKIKDQLKESETKDINSYEDMIGESYYFRTVTYHTVGKVIKKIGCHLELECASWIPDSGRFMQTIKSGELSEVEPVGKCFINIEATVDFFPWVHELPENQK